MKNDLTKETNQSLSDSDQFKLEPEDLSFQDSTEKNTVTNVNSRTEDSSLEERIKEDLKTAYSAHGILDIAYGGFGFLQRYGLLCHLHFLHS